MPYPTEHSCRLREPRQDARTARTTRTTEEGKDYDVILQQQQDGNMADQAYRYGIEEWTESEAREHCQDHNGILFEPAEPDADEDARAIASMPITANCFANHLGVWAIEPIWFREAFAAIRSGLWSGAPRPRAQEDKDEGDKPYDTVEGSIALVQLTGPMMKGESKYGGTSTVAVRRAIRQATADDGIEGILLSIDSPGGHTSGTGELARDVRRADSIKPVYSHVEDCCASAAYWVASQSRMIAASPGSEVGSIGTMAVVEDTSKASEMEGVTVHVISTGAYKGAFVEGAAVPPEHLAYLQERVNGANRHFLQAVQAGRGMDPDALRSIADGRVFDADKGLDIGLVDRVQSIDATVNELAGMIADRTARKRRAAARQIRRARAEL